MAQDRKMIHLEHDLIVLAKRITQDLYGQDDAEIEMRTSHQRFLAVCAMIDTLYELQYAVLPIEDKKLLQDLIQELSKYVGETGENESALEVVIRLRKERNDALLTLAKLTATAKEALRTLTSFQLGNKQEDQK